MYDPLYELLPEFEQKSGRQVQVAARLVHPELNAHLEKVYRAGTGAQGVRAGVSSPPPKPASRGLGSGFGPGARLGLWPLGSKIS